MSEEHTERPTAPRSDEMASAIRRIATASELYDVRTIATFARLHTDAPEGGVPVSVGLAITLNAQIAEAEFRIVGKFTLKAHEGSQLEKQSFFSASIHLVAYYRLNTGKTLTQEDFQAFARSNGMIHLWPYFRAFVQQSCGQFSIPPIVLPPFRANRPLNVRFVEDEHGVPEPLLDMRPTESFE